MRASPDPRVNWLAAGPMMAGHPEERGGRMSNVLEEDEVVALLEAAEKSKGQLASASGLALLLLP